MSKKSLFDPPAKPVNKIAKPRFSAPQGATAADKMKSTGSYSGAAPRVGSDKKKAVVAKKPSSVSSGWKPAKAKKRRY